MSSGIEMALCWKARAVHTRAAAALATRPITTLVHGISKNNAYSGHILPNYAASLKYAFSAENSAGIIRQTLLAPIKGPMTKCYYWHQQSAQHRAKPVVLNLNAQPAVLCGHESSGICAAVAQCIIASHVIVGMDSTNPRPRIPGSIPWYWPQRANDRGLDWSIHAAMRAAQPTDTPHTPMSSPSGAAV